MRFVLDAALVARREDDAGLPTKVQVRRMNAHEAVVAFLRLTPTSRVHIMQTEFGMTDATWDTGTTEMMHHLRDGHLVAPFIEYMANLSDRAPLGATPDSEQRDIGPVAIGEPTKASP